MLERTGYVSYANCGLPYYVGGVIRRKEALTLQTPQSFRERFRVEVRVHHEAVKIDPASQTVTVRRLDDGSVYEERYDELILSPGARAVKPELPARIWSRSSPCGRWRTPFASIPICNPTPPNARW